MKPMPIDLAYIILSVVWGLVFVVVGAWATVDLASHVAYWVRRIQGALIVIGAITLSAWAIYSLIIGGKQ